MKRAFITFALSCLLSTPFTASSAESAKQDPTGSGRVLLRVFTNATQINVFFGRFEEAVVESVDEKPKTHTLHAYGPASPQIVPAPAETVALSGDLPPGNYRIKTLRAQSGSMTTAAEVSDTLPPFEIAKDTVTDLGVLVVQPVGNGQAVILPVADVGNTPRHLQRSGVAEPWSSAPTTTWQADETNVQRFAFGDTEGGANLGLVGAVLYSKLDSDARLSAQQRWDSAKSVADFMALAKSATVALSEPAVAPDGTMYFGSALGQISQRSSQGAWTTLDTGTLAVVSAVTLIGSDLYAGLEDGRILQLKDGEWVAAGQLPGAARIARIAQFANGDWWLAAQAWSGKETVLSAYITKSLADIPPTPAKSLAQAGPGFWSAAKSPMTAVVGKSRGYLVTPEVELHAYDSATATWEAPRLKKNAPLFRGNNDATVLFSMRPALLSTDGGTTWGSLKPGGALHGLAFFDAANGLGLFATDAMTWSGSQELRKTTDGGKTWVRMQKLEKSPCHTPSLRQNDVTQRLICVFRDGNIHSAGMTGDWIAERVMH